MILQGFSRNFLTQFPCCECDCRSKHKNYGIFKEQIVRKGVTRHGRSNSRSKVLEVDVGKIAFERDDSEK